MEATPATASRSCLLVKDVSSEYSESEIANAFNIAVNIQPELAEVTKNVLPNSMSGKSNVLVTLPAGCEVPRHVEIEIGYSQNLVDVLFTESAVIWLETPNLVPQYFHFISEQAKILQVTVEQIGTDIIKASGQCAQLSKLRNYVAKLLSRAHLDSSNNLPQAHVQEQFRSSRADICSQPTLGGASPLSLPPPGARVISNLSSDVLLLMPKLPYIITPGVQYCAHEERVFILGKDDQNASSDAFLEAYHKVTSSVKSGEIHINAEHSKDEVNSVLIEYNQRYKQCFFAFNDQNGKLKIISTSSRQFEQAKKLLTEMFCQPVVQPVEQLKFPSGRVLTVKKANIVDEQCPVIVNAANSQLDHGGGVAGALNAASNGELQLHSSKHINHCGTVPVGDVAHTKAGGNLKCKHVLHAVGPNAAIPGMDDKQCYKLIRLATSKALSMADKLKASSIAFPALSTGIYGVSRSISARAMLSAIEDYKCSKKGLLDDVRIVIIDAPTYVSFAQEIVMRRIRFQQDASLTGTSGTNASTSVANTVSPSSTKIVNPSASASSTDTIASASGAFTVPSSATSATSSASAPSTSTVTTSASAPSTSTVSASAPSTSTVSASAPSTSTVTASASAPSTSTVTTSASTASTSTVTASASAPSTSTVSASAPSTNTVTFSGSSASTSTVTFSGSSASTSTVTTSASAPSTSTVTSSASAASTSTVTTSASATSTASSAVSVDTMSWLGALQKSPLRPATFNHSVSRPDKSQITTTDHGMNTNHHHRHCSSKTGKSQVAACLSNQKSTQDNPARQPTPDNGAKQLESCPICLDKITDPVKLNCCSKIFCRKCIHMAVATSPYCPTCKFPLREVVGNQPHGRMTWHLEQTPLPGYNNCGTIVIYYEFPDGVQSAQHPNPGSSYAGTHRTAYLPDNKEGHEVLQLLRRAFDQLLLFTVGTSVTTGATNVVVWNDVHHKTSRYGGTFGYPDNTYLRRVKEELKAKGIY